MDDVLRAGIAMFNAGYYHPAHDAWEDRWLEVADDDPDERFLHGLIQYTAAVHHLATDNDEGARGLAESAHAYLAELPDPYRDVSLDPIRTTLVRITRDIADVDPADMPPMTHRNEAVTLNDLDRHERRIVARIVAEHGSDWSATTIERAIDLADTAEAGNRFAALLQDFVLDPDHRGVIYDRLASHVERERGRRAAVEDLFRDEE